MIRTLGVANAVVCRGVDNGNGFVNFACCFDSYVVISFVNLVFQMQSISLNREVHYSLPESRQNHHDSSPVRCAVFTVRLCFY